MPVVYQKWICKCYPKEDTHRTLHYQFLVNQIKSILFCGKERERELIRKTTTSRPTKDAPKTKFKITITTKYRKDIFQQIAKLALDTFKNKCALDALSIVQSKFVQAFENKFVVLKSNISFGQTAIFSMHVCVYISIDCTVKNVRDRNEKMR